MSHAPVTEENEAIVEQYSEYVQQRQWDELRDHVTDDFIVHEPDSIDPEPADIEAHIATLEPFEWRIKILDIFAQGEKVATREVIHATQIEEYRGVPPSDTEMTADSILIWRIEDGKVAEVWSSPDSYALMDQLGMTFPQILMTLPKVILRKALS